MRFPMLVSLAVLAKTCLRSRRTKAGSPRTTEDRTGGKGANASVGVETIAAPPLGAARQRHYAGIVGQCVICRGGRVGMGMTGAVQPPATCAGMADAGVGVVGNWCEKCVEVLSW